MAPKTEPKSRFLDVQEGTYLKIAEDVKISFSRQRKRHFGLPRESQNRSKIDEKSDLRACYVEVTFQYPLETLSEPSWTCLGRDLGKKHMEPKLDPQLEPSWHSKPQRKRDKRDLNINTIFRPNEGG